MKLCIWVLSLLSVSLCFREVWGWLRDRLQGLCWILIMQLLFKLWINSCLKRMRHLCWLCVLDNFCYERPLAGMKRHAEGLLYHVSYLRFLSPTIFPFGSSLSFLFSNLLQSFSHNSPQTYESITVVDAECGAALICPVWQERCSRTNKDLRAHVCIHASNKTASRIGL